ncbi:MAG: hypothetical protein ACYC0M_12050 [Burkholderiales bacterium]
MANSYNDWSTAVVVIGLVVEFFALLFFSKDMSKAEKTLLVIGSILVAVGVGGEYIFSGRATSAAIALQQASDQKIAGLQRDQEEDHKIATQAAAYAARLGVTVKTLPDFVKQKEGEFNAQFGKLKAFTIDEHKQTAALNAELDRDKGDFEKARTDSINAANIAIQATMPRGLTSEQQSAFVETMKPFAGLTVNLWTLFSSTPDAAPLANLLGSLLRNADWHVGVANGLSGYAKEVLVVIGEKSKPNVEAAAVTMVRILRADNIASEIDNKESPELQMASVGTLLPKPDIAVVIGSKP